MDTPIFRRFRQNNYIWALRSLASLQPIFPIERSLEAIEALGVGRSSRVLEALRVRSLVSRRLSAVESPGAMAEKCLAALGAKGASLRHMHAVLEANLAQLDQIARVIGLELFGGKGVAALAMYPDPSVREFNDVDLFVRSHADAACLSQALRTEFGYRYQDDELPWLKLDASDRMLYGQMALAAPADRPHLLNIDIHFGDYSVRHCGRLNITETFPPGSPGLHLIAPDVNLACIVNNAAGDYFVTAKDTNDLLLTISRPDFDPARFCSLIRRAHLGSFFSRVVEALRFSSALTDEQELRLRALPVGHAFEPAPRPDLPNWRRRCLGTTLHAFAVRRADGIVPAAKTAASAFFYYRKRLRLTVLSKEGPVPVRSAEWNTWTCIRLVPIDLAITLIREAGGVADDASAPPTVGTVVAGDPDVERFDVPSGMYFRIADEFFVGTVTYDLYADVIREAAAAAGHSR